MRRFVAVAVLVSFAFVGSSFGFINWFNTSSNRISYADGTTYLYGSSSSAAGCFVQLIWAGSDGLIDAAVASGTGVSGDDVVAGYSYFGSGFFSDRNGRVGGAASVYTNSGLYYVRAWTAPASDYASGLVATSTTNFYGNSGLFSYTQPEPESQVDFNFGGAGDVNNVGFSADISLAAIPEPTIVGLGLIGLMTLRLYRRRK